MDLFPQEVVEGDEEEVAMRVTEDAGELPEVAEEAGGADGLAVGTDCCAFGGFVGGDLEGQGDGGVFDVGIVSIVSVGQIEED